MTLPTFAAVLGACLAIGQLTTHPAESELTTAGACAAPAYHQFDFFAGDWDVYAASAPAIVIARNHVTPMLDGCALREVYEKRDGLRGESFSTYDASRQIWHQSWVTNRGELLLLDGAWDGARMVLTAMEQRSGQAASRLRGTWWRENDAVRERAERSEDGGRTWRPVFDLIFKVHRSARAPE